LQNPIFDHHKNSEIEITIVKLTAFTTQKNSDPREKLTILGEKMNKLRTPKLEFLTKNVFFFDRR